MVVRYPRALQFVGWVSFRTPNPARSTTELRQWIKAVAGIRRGTGLLWGAYPIDPDVDIRVVYVPAASDPGAPVEDEALTRLTAAGVTAAPLTEAHRVASHGIELLRAAGYHVDGCSS